MSDDRPNIAHYHRLTPRHAWSPPKSTRTLPGITRTMLEAMGTR